MTAEMHVGFFARHDQKIAIRMAPRRFEVSFLFRQPQRPRIFGVTIPWKSDIIAMLMPSARNVGIQGGWKSEAACIQTCS
jgi:hypothetical protein